MAKTKSTERRWLDRVLGTDDLARVVAHLQPEVLHRVIQHCGLEECGELMVLATPDQLVAVLDLDLWRARRPGLDEQFDADRFGVWLEVLVESGAAVAARIVSRLDADLVTAALASHLRVFDPAAGIRDSEHRSDLGGYLVVPKRTDSWDAIVAVLMSLAAAHHEFFHRVMSGCRRLSNSAPEIDGRHDLATEPEQVLFDLAVDRERRREKQGYVTPAQARAFLQMSRRFHAAEKAGPLDNPVARAYFRAFDRTEAPDLTSAPAPDAHENSFGAVVNALLEAGILPQPPRALLDGPQKNEPRLALVRQHMRFVRDSDPVAYSARSQELAYLANTIVVGCSIQGRVIEAQEASQAVAAVCNLGLENWPSRKALAADFLVDHDLVRVFQVGWTVLHEDVCMYVANQLITLLHDLRCDDRDVQFGLFVLRTEMAKHCAAGTPWRARGALDVIAILDQPAWVALLALIDEFPAMHAALDASRDARTRSIDASRFEFISENRQIETIREFLRALPDTLGAVTTTPIAPPAARPRARRGRPASAMPRSRRQ